MPSFDIVSKVDAQALDNAVNVTTKEISNRFDFKGSHVAINLDKKEFRLNIEMKDGSVLDLYEIVRSLWENGQVTEERYFKG